MADDLRALMAAHFTSRVERLEPHSPGMARRPIPALGGRTIADAMHSQDVWELVDRTLSRHEEPILSQIIGFEAFLVDGLGPDRFVMGPYPEIDTTLHHYYVYFTDMWEAFQVVSANVAIVQ